MKKQATSLTLLLCMFFTLFQVFITPVKADTSLFTIKNGILVRYGDDFGIARLEKVIIPNEVIEIGKEAFYDHTEMKSISIPNSVKKISEGAFWGCSSLDSIVVPSSVTYIGNNALGYDRTGKFHTKHDGFVIEGTSGSQAQIYADQNGFKFVELSQTGASSEWKQNSTGWWYKEGSSWATGWRLIDGNWYYFNSDGYMVTNTSVGGYYLNENGVWSSSMS